MLYDTKIAIVLLAGLLDWQKLNVAAFLGGAIAIAEPGLHGRAFVNADRVAYFPFIRQPILIYKADDDAQMQRAFQRAKERELRTGIYTKPLFATMGEAENLAAVAACTDESQELAGFIMFGENKKVDKALKDLKFHP